MNLIVPIILFVSSIGIFFGYIDPTYKATEGLSSQLAQYESALSNSKELLSEKKALVDKLNKFDQADLDKLGKLLPDTVDSVTLIIEINSIAAQYNMHIRNFGGGIQAQAGALGQSLTPYSSLPLTFTTTASYETFIAFLKALETNLRLVDVAGITFSAQNQTSSIYDFSFNINTYSLK